MKRCPRCMQSFVGDACPNCKGQPKVIKDGLSGGQLLASRYLIGAALAQSRQAVCYAALDNTTQKPVLVEEFFPRGAVTREGMSVVPKREFATRFREALAFEPAGREQLCMETVSTNGTIYRVYQPAEEQDLTVQAEILLDTPVLFRNRDGAPLYSINLLSIPALPRVRKANPPRKVQRRKNLIRTVILIILALLIMVGGVAAVLCGQHAKETLADAQPELTGEALPVASEAASELLTEQPTETPTETPMATPTETPAERPTEAPTETPMETPTEAPTETPTETPTEAPTETPAETPTEAPSPTPVPTFKLRISFECASPDAAAPQPKTIECSYQEEKKDIILPEGFCFAEGQESFVEIVWENGQPKQTDYMIKVVPRKWELLVTFECNVSDVEAPQPKTIECFYQEEKKDIILPEGFCIAEEQDDFVKIEWINGEPVVSDPVIKVVPKERQITLEFVLENQPPMTKTVTVAGNADEYEIKESDLPPYYALKEGVTKVTVYRLTNIVRVQCVPARVNVTVNFTNEKGVFDTQTVEATYLSPFTVGIPSGYYAEDGVSLQKICQWTEVTTENLSPLTVGIRSGFLPDIMRKMAYRWKKSENEVEDSLEVRCVPWKTNLDITLRGAGEDVPLKVEVSYDQEKIGEDGFQIFKVAEDPNVQRILREEHNGWELADPERSILFQWKDGEWEMPEVGSDYFTVALTPRKMTLPVKYICKFGEQEHVLAEKEVEVSFTDTQAEVEGIYGYHIGSQTIPLEWSEWQDGPLPAEEIICTPWTGTLTTAYVDQAGNSVWKDEIQLSYHEFPEKYQAKPEAPDYYSLAEEEQQYEIELNWEQDQIAVWANVAVVPWQAKLTVQFESGEEYQRMSEQLTLVSGSHGNAAVDIGALMDSGESADGASYVLGEKTPKTVTLSFVSDGELAGRDGLTLNEDGSYTLHVPVEKKVEEPEPSEQVEKPEDSGESEKPEETRTAEETEGTEKPEEFEEPEETSGDKEYTLRFIGVGAQIEGIEFTELYTMSEIDKDVDWLSLQVRYGNKNADIHDPVVKVDEKGQKQIEVQISILNPDFSYKQGDKGVAIAFIQTRLAALGYYQDAEKPVTFVYDEAMAQALYLFQQVNGAASAEETALTKLPAELCGMLFAEDAKPFVKAEALDVPENGQADTGDDANAENDTDAVNDEESDSEPDTDADAEPDVNEEASSAVSGVEQTTDESRTDSSIQARLTELGYYQAAPDAPEDEAAIAHALYLFQCVQLAKDRSAEKPEKPVKLTDELREKLFAEDAVRITWLAELGVLEYGQYVERISEDGPDSRQIDRNVVPWVLDSDDFPIVWKSQHAQTAQNGSAKPGWYVIKNSDADYSCWLLLEDKDDQENYLINLTVQACSSEDDKPAEKNTDTDTESGKAAEPDASPEKPAASASVDDEPNAAPQGSGSSGREETEPENQQTGESEPPAKQ